MTTAYLAVTVGPSPCQRGTRQGSREGRALNKCHLAVSLYEHGRLLRQVVFVTAAQGVLLMSYEVRDGVMVGSHHVIDPDRLPEVEARLINLRSEWETGFGCTARVHRPPQILTS